MRSLRGRNACHLSRNRAQDSLQVLRIERLEELFHSPIDLVEIEVIDNPYFKEAVEESKVPLYGTP